MAAAGQNQPCREIADPVLFGRGHHTIRQFFSQVRRRGEGRKPMGP